LLFVAFLQVNGQATLSWGDWTAAATYTMNFRHHRAWEMGHIWSLSIEEHFYLLWPPFVALLPRRSAVGGLVGVLVLGPLLRWAVLLGWPAWTPMLELWTFTRLDTIAAGCLLGLLGRSPLPRRALDGLARGWPIALALFLGGMVCACLSGKFAEGVAPSLTAATLAALVWASVRREPRWLEHPLLGAVGIGSYSLYLWQQVFLNPYQARWWTSFPQNLLLAACAATASYWSIERPFLRIKDRLQGRLPRPTGTGTRKVDLREPVRTRERPTFSLPLLLSPRDQGSGGR
jgi:peptidoglycan/LPS O-acetylase OafA/YrhL